MSCDNLIGAEIVTAEGERVYASEQENADLLWALRGGGGNFGIVTSFEFRLHALGAMVAVAFPFYALRDAVQVMQQWRDWVLEAPDEVTSEIVLWTAPATADLPPEVHGQQIVIPAAVYAGPPAEGERVLQVSRTFAEPLGEIAGILPFRAVQQAFDPHFPNTGEICGYWKSNFFDELGDEAIEVLVERTANRSSPRTLLGLEHIGGGAAQRVSPDACAYTGREPFECHVVGIWEDPAESEMHIEWVRDAWQRLRPYSTGSVYLNFLGRDGEDARDLVRSAFGANYDRLVALKRKYDPDNFFRLNQNIAP